MWGTHTGAHAGIAPSVPIRCSLRRSRHRLLAWRSIAKRRPVGRRLPLLSYREFERRPHPAEPAADEPRRFRAVKGLPARDARQRALAGAVPAWQAQQGSCGWDAVVMDSGPWAAGS